MFDTIRWQVLLVALAGWVNRHQLEVIAYMREENRVLKEQIGGRRLRFTDPVDVPPLDRAERASTASEHPVTIRTVLGSVEFSDRTGSRFPGNIHAA